MNDIDLGPDPLALDRQVCFALSIASRSVIGLYRPVLEPLKLTHPQYLVMLALWDRYPRSVNDLARTLRHEPATLSPLLKRLEHIGYVRRQRSHDDERTLVVTLTDTGENLRSEAEKVPYKIVETLGLDVSMLERLHTDLYRVIEATDP